MPERMERAAPRKGMALTRVVIFDKDASPGGTRRKRFVASDETVDRYGDIIRASGWQLDNFRRNPVLLFGHVSRSLPLGKVEPIAVEGTRLIAHAEFTPDGTSAFNDTVWHMVDQGFLNAVSVSFMPLADPNPMFDASKQLTGFEFVAQELLELSVVTVPANPNAIALAKGLGLGGDDLRLLFEHPPDGRAAAVAAQQRRNLIATTRPRRVF
jgi:hypothetical protein